MTNEERKKLFLESERVWRAYQESMLDLTMRERLLLEREWVSESQVMPMVLCDADKL